MKEGTYLITCDNWFYAPDGKQYNAVWGNVKILQDSEVQGIKTNARSANWFACVGTEENHVIVAGCQIHYSVRCDKKPHTGAVSEKRLHEGKQITYNREGNIYIAE